MLSGRRLYDFFKIRKNWTMILGKVEGLTIREDKKRRRRGKKEKAAMMKTKWK